MASMTAAEKKAKFAELRKRFSDGTITNAEFNAEIQKMSDDVTPSEMVFSEFGNPNIANWPTLEVPGDGVKAPIISSSAPVPETVVPGNNNIQFVTDIGIPEGSDLPFNEGNKPMGADPSMGSLINPLAFGVSPDLQALGIQDPFGAYTATRSRGVPVYDPRMGSMAGYQSALGMGYQPELGRFFLSPSTQGTCS